MDPRSSTLRQNKFYDNGKVSGQFYQSNAQWWGWNAQKQWTDVHCCIHMLGSINWAGDCLLYLSSKVEFNQIQIFFFQFKNRSKSTICCENGESGKIAEIKKLSIHSILYLVAGIHGPPFFVLGPDQDRTARFGTNRFWSVDPCIVAVKPTILFWIRILSFSQ